MIKYVRDDNSKVYVEYIQRKNLLKVKFYNLDSMFEQDGLILSNILFVYHSAYPYIFFDHHITMCLSINYPTIKNNLIFKTVLTEEQISKCLKNSEILKQAVDKIICSNTSVAKPKQTQIKNYINNIVLQYLIKSVNDFAEIKCTYRGL